MKFALGQSLQRFHRLGRERRRLLMWAAAALTCSSAAVALLPFRRAVGYGSVPLGRRRSKAYEADCVWAVEKAAERMPWRTLCFEKGIAVQRLLRKSGIDALLHYGARHEPGTGKLQAHVWVTVAGQIVIGGEDAVGYEEIAAFP
jgi:hypothetical protein